MRSLLLFCALLLAAVPAFAERPNLIIINIDDLGYGDIQPFGAAGPHPHLSRLAAEGRKLLSHYAAPVCSPSRAALMTGCYPKRVLQIPGVLFPASKVGLNPREQNIAKVLHGAGYATGIVGKWHLGDQPDFLPLQQGFDYFYGQPYSNDMGPEADGAKSNLGAAPRDPRPNAKQPPDDETGIHGSQQPPLALMEGNKVVARVDAPAQSTLAHQYTEKATDFIRRHREKPFFLYLAHSAVHFPFYPAPEFHRKTDRLLRDVILEVDWSVGEVMETLRREKLAEKTLVIFTSDNGGAVNQGANNGPLRGTKNQTLEGGIRTPTIAWWPGHVPAGTETRAITSMMDLLPTFAAAAGIALPATSKIDGQNLLPLLEGRSGAEGRPDFFYFRGPVLEAVRIGQWKLHLATEELYDLEADLGESKNVAAAHPETVAQLKVAAARVDGDLDAKGYGPGCRPMGRVAEARPLISPAAPKPLSIP